MPKPEILNRASADKLALFDRLKTGKPGDVVTWDELAEVIGRPVKAGTLGYEPLRRARWKCVRDLGVVWEPVSAHDGLKCLNDSETVALGVHALGAIRRRARRSNVKMAAVNAAKLDNADKLTLAGVMALNAAIESAATEKSLKRIEASVGDNPKPLPVARTLEILKT